MKYKTIADDVAKNQAKRFEIQQQEKEVVLINQWEKEKFKDKVKKERALKIKNAEILAKAKQTKLTPLEKREMDLIN